MMVTWRLRYSRNMPSEEVLSQTVDAALAEAGRKSLAFSGLTHRLLRRVLRHPPSSPSKEERWFEGRVWCRRRSSISVPKAARLAVAEDGPPPALDCQAAVAFAPVTAA